MRTSKILASLCIFGAVVFSYTVGFLALTQENELLTSSPVIDSKENSREDPAQALALKDALEGANTGPLKK